MDCIEVDKFISTYLDGEFAEAERQAMLAHLSSCKDCKRLVTFEKRVRERLRESLPMVETPAHLRKRIHVALCQIAAREHKQTQKKRHPSRTWPWYFFAPIGATTVVLALAFFIKQEAPERLPSEHLAEQSVEWHRKKLPMDISGPNPETVQQFFSDKVPFAVHFPRFKSKRAQLIGGRLSNLSAHQAVYLRYHVADDGDISVFIFDSNAVPSEGPRKRVGNRDVFWKGLRGYNVAMYRAGDTGYAVASEMDSNRLVQLIAHSQ